MRQRRDPRDLRQAGPAQGLCPHGLRQRLELQGLRRLHEGRLLMDFSSPLVRGRLVSRYKRFFADVVLDDGTALTAHCPNPGAMLGLNTPGLPAWLSRSDDPKRKLAHTLEL